MRLNFAFLRQPRLLGALARWHAARLYALFGLPPLLISVLGLMLLIYWCGVLRPELSEMRSRQRDIQQQLSVPLPVIGLEDKIQRLSTTEYQQVKALFAILEKHGLQTKESRYQLQADSNDASAEQLTLEIPLTGEYPHLYAALQELSAAMPLRIETLKLSRATPASVQLTVLLRVTLTETHS